MINRANDPRTADRISFELISTTASGDPEVVGRAVFSRGQTSVEAEERVAVAVRELLERPFVDRVQADERPRGYRRSARGQVDLLVPGMAEHFLARMRGLWLSFPDGSVITARPESGGGTSTAMVEQAEGAPIVVEPNARRGTLASSDETAGGPPLVRGHAPLNGTRPGSSGARVHRTDCGWIV